MFSKKIFSERLKKIRTENKVSMQSLAEAVGKSKPAVSQFESGSNLPNIETLVALADFFDVSIDYLVGRSDNPRRR